MSRHSALLQRAADYALGALDAVRPELLSRPTPCAKWNLHMLLNHISASVAAFQEGLFCGRIDLFPNAEDRVAIDSADFVRARIRRLVADWTVTDGRPVAVADQRIPLSLLCATAALEIAVHGWDIYQASGRYRPIPESMAADLLAISKQLIIADIRPGLFASPIDTVASASTGKQLLAFLGRQPAAVQSLIAETT
jgi:uncharacterized protein (TIGR03086 family)